MKIKATLLSISIILLLAGCGVEGVETEMQGSSSGNQESDLIGYVVEKEGDRILVVNPNSKDYSSSGGISHHYAAIWFSHAPDEIVAGQKVEVWIEGGVNDSYPGQAKAERVSLLDQAEPDGALLSEAEAIRQALSSPQLEEYTVPVIKDVIFDTSASTWTVYVTRNGDEEVIEITVEDRAVEQENELGETEPTPPMPTIKAGDQAITVYQSSYCWNNDSQGLCVDYAGPVDMLKKKPVDQVKANELITFDFDIEKQPTEITLSTYHDGVETHESLTGNSFPAPQEEGIYYFDLFAVWLVDKDRRISEGSSSYVFAIEVVGE